MRHRAIPVDLVRPAKKPPVPDNPPKPDSKICSTVTVAILAVLSVAMLVGGLAVASINSSANMHRHMAREYRQYLLEWDAKYLPQLQPLKATLQVNDAISVPMPLTMRPTKQTVLLPGGPSPDPAAPAGASSKPRAKAERFSSQHVDFKAEGLLAQLGLPGRGPRLQLTESSAGLRGGPGEGEGYEGRDAEDEAVAVAAGDAKPERSGKKRKHKYVTMDMLQPVTLKVVLESPGDGGRQHAAAAGAEATHASTIDLGSHALARVVNVTARSKRDCTKRQWGVWDPHAKVCQVVDYLDELCFKIQDEPGVAVPQYRLEYSHGGTGCHPRLDWQPDAWKRAATHLVAASTTSLAAADGGSAWAVALPGNAATGGPRVVVRHARDPELEERALLNRMNKLHQPAMAAHAIGLAMVFLGLVGIVSLLCVSVPALEALWRSREDEDGKIND